MPLCGLCGKFLSCKSSLTRHVATQHKQQPAAPPTVITVACGECGDIELPLKEMREHFTLSHGALETFKHCGYCNTAIHGCAKFAAHMWNVHGLPVRQVEEVCKHRPTNSAVKNSFKLFTLPVSNANDLYDSLVSNMRVIEEIAADEVRQHPVKIQLGTEVHLVKPLVENEDDEFEMNRGTEFFANSEFHEVYSDGLHEEDIWKLVDKLVERLVSFNRNGSGWVIRRVHSIVLKVVTYLPLRGSSYIALPGKLNKFQCLLNIKNVADHNCFEYCWTAAKLLRDEPVSSPSRDYQTYSRSNPKATIPIGEFSKPMPISQMAEFEQVNETSVNVFYYHTEEKVPIPLRLSRRKDEFELNLLLLTDGDHHHFVLIMSLESFLCKLRNVGVKKEYIACRNCLHVCCSPHSYRQHVSVCSNFEAATVRMPAETVPPIKFKRHAARWYVPTVVYFDIEAILQKVETVADQPNASHTEVVNIHEPCGYAYTVINYKSPEKEKSTAEDESNKDNKPIVILKRGENCMESFLDNLIQLAKDVHISKRKNWVFRGEPTKAKERVTECWICEKTFDQESDKVLDHDHMTGMFLGWAHNKCNLMRKTCNYIPVVSHNLKGYDMHHIIKLFGKLDPKHKITVIPVNGEQYMSVDIAVFIKTQVDKNGKVWNTYEHLRFIDSLQFTHASLEKLAQTLPPDCFEMLRSHYGDKSSLICRKGFYPYHYMDSFEKFENTALPPLTEWKDSMQKLTITQENLDHARRVWVEFGIQNMGEYHDLYLTSDVLLLACVFEEYRKLSYKAYGLDCAHFYTASNLAGEAFLKVSKAEIELLKEREQLDMVESMKRGGLASVYNERYHSANNVYMDNYDFDKPDSFLFFIDANNLYGGVMSRYKLPIGDFQMVNVDINKIMETPDDSERGYILEVDLDYPVELHDMHKDFPLAPTKESVKLEWLSSHQRWMVEELNVKPTATQKLLQTLFPKHRYTLHYITLKLYVELGLKIKKVHRVLQFRQTHWMKPYIELNTKLRQQARNTFERNFYKLLTNAAYGKCCESKRRRRLVEIVRTRDEAVACTKTPLLANFNIVSEDLVIVSRKPHSILWDKPIIVGASVLDLAKHFMFAFHYRTMKSHFNCSLLYSDTDSFLYRVDTDDLYEDLKHESLEGLFDFSNYKENHPLYNDSHAMTVLKFKDETSGEVVSEFVGLKPKCYSVLTEGDNSKKSAKGVSRNAQAGLSHEMYKATLFATETSRAVNVRIQSRNHQLETVHANKIVLSAYDDKRYILEDGITTRPYGHYQNEGRHSPVLFDETPNEDQLIEPYIEARMTQSTAIFDLLTPTEEPWTTPDPGFNQSPVDDDDLSDVVDFDHLPDSMPASPTHDPIRSYYVNDEAEEDNETHDDVGDVDDDDDDDDEDEPIQKKKSKPTIYIIDSD